MMEQDSFSMTPPISPGMQGELNDEAHFMLFDELIDTTPFCLTCQGAVIRDKNRNCHSDSFLRKGILQRLLNGKPVLNQDAESLTIELFNQHFVVPLALDEMMDQLFFLWRQQINKLESKQQPAFTLGATGIATECMNIRQNSRRFVEYVQLYVQRYLPVERLDEILPRLLLHLRGLLLFLGYISDFSYQILTGAPSTKGNQNPLPGHHLFHLHLEVQWGLLEILHIVSVKFPNFSPDLKISRYGQAVDISEPDVFAQAVQRLLWDLVLLAIKEHDKINLVDYSRVTPFLCSCVREIFIMVLQLLQHRQKQFTKESFWVSLYPILQHLMNQPSTRTEDDLEIEMDCDVFALPPHYECRDPIGFCWWFISHLAELGLYDEFGAYSSNKGPVQSNYQFLTTLMKKSLACNEASLSSALRCCIRISRLWEANTTVLNTLWEYFYKKMNHQFQVPGAGLSQLACISKSSTGLLEQCQKLVEGNSKCLEQSNSFQLFLILVSIHLGKSTDKGNANPQWRQMKGRFYSKFHSRRMQELSGTGLHNFTLLFLTLAQTADLQDVAGRMVDLLGVLGGTDLDITRQVALYKAHFALILYYVQNDTDVTFLAEKLVQSFNKVCKEFTLTMSDPTRYSELWRLLSIYIESTQDVIENSSLLALHEYKLFGEGFRDLLPTCRDNELRIILNMLQAILTKHRIVYKRSVVQTSQQLGGNPNLQHCRGLSDALWKNCYTFVREQSCSLTPQPQLADIAAGIAFLSMDMPPSVHSGMKEDFASCFGYFAWNENVNAEVSCRFLSHILPNQAAIRRLRAELPNLEPLLIRAWFRCAWLITGQNDQMQELTRLMLKLPVIVDLFDCQQYADSQQYATGLFIKALGKGYTMLQDLREKIEYRERVEGYLGDVMKYVGLALKNCPSADLMRNVYNLGGLLVKHCPTLLYIKSKPDCLLPQLIDRLAVPRILLHTNKPPPQYMLSAIRDHLHLFIQGLSRLDYRKDPYVQRKLKDIMTQHLPRFPVSVNTTLSASSVHPLLRALNETQGRVVNINASAFRRYFLEVLKNEYLIVKGTTLHNQANMAWNYILQLLNKTLNESEIAKDSVILLPVCLDVLLISDNSSTKHQVSNVLQILIQSCSQNSLAIDREELLTVLRSFLDQHLPVYQGKTLRVLESLAVLHPALMTSLIPDMTRAVQISETKRGVGIDKQLRFIYCTLLQNLGETGQNERSKLLLNDS